MVDWLVTEKDMGESDIRDIFIERVARGKSFVDIGGLWGIQSEKLSLAQRSGATRLAMVDITPRQDGTWAKLREHLKTKGVEKYEEYSTDVHHWVTKPFDVVHSAGVLYHLPSPMAYLAKLRTLAAEFAIITSAVTQEVITNEAGEYRVPSSGVIFVPALTEEQRLVLAAYWGRFGSMLGITDPFPYDLEDYAPPWWWLPTVSALRCMCQLSRFEIVDEGYYWHNNAYTLLLR
jgi:hypothetical protein